MPPTPVTIHARPRPALHTGAGAAGLLTAGGSSSSHHIRRLITVAPRAAPLPEPKLLAPPPTANQRRKARPAVPIPTSELLSSTMVPQNITIVTRCLAHIDPPSPSGGSSSGGAGNGARKRSSHQHTPTASPGPAQFHTSNPYSRLTDLANTRSTIPSPQELARAERAEEEKARQKKENAAAARAAAALARRRKALRSGRGSRTPSASVAPPSAPVTMIPPIQRAMARERARSVEASMATSSNNTNNNTNATLTAEPEDTAQGSSSALTSRGLKRTRSSGLSNVTTPAPGTVSINSPLRTVTNGDDHPPAASSIAMKKESSTTTTAAGDDAPARKRSRLADLPARAPSARRASTTSPAGSTSSLPAEATISPPKTRGGNNGNASLSPTEPTASAMRRVVSATDGTAARRVSGSGSSLRTASVGPDSTRERSRRDVQPPARMRDYT